MMKMWLWLIFHKIFCSFHLIYRNHKSMLLWWYPPIYLLYAKIWSGLNLHRFCVCSNNYSEFVCAAALLFTCAYLLFWLSYFFCTLLHINPQSQEEGYLINIPSGLASCSFLFSTLWSIMCPYIYIHLLKIQVSLVRLWRSMDIMINC